MRLICTAPMGELQILPLRLVVQAGEAFDVPDTVGLGLLEQRGNVALPTGSKALDGLTVDDLAAVAAGRGLDLGEKPKKAAALAAVAADIPTLDEPKEG